MMDDKVHNLILELSKKTDDKMAVWNRAANSEQFYIVLKSAMFKIDKIINKDRYVILQVSILNEKGDVIFIYNSTREQSPGDFNFLLEFHNKVKKSYFKVDETIDGLFNEIKNASKEFGEDDGLPF